MNRLQKKWSVRSIAATLACSMLISALPVNALAETLQNLRQESISTEPEILYEIEFMREKNAKVFYRSDGINVAMMTPQALHYRDDNGEWQDIDNTLVEQEDGSLTNADAGYETVLPETLAEDPVTIEKDGHELQFTLLNLDKKAKAKENTKEKKEKKVKREKKKDTVEGMVETENLESTVEYIDAATDTDITFDVQPEAVKESIILKKKPKKNAKYTYFVKADGMTAVLKDDRSIEFTPNGEKEAEFILPAPYMFDSSDVERYSTDIEVSLEKAEGGYTITYTPDQNWLRNKETTYPVTIDPTVEVYPTKGMFIGSYVLNSSSIQQATEITKFETSLDYITYGGNQQTTSIWGFQKFAVSNGYLVTKAELKVDYKRTSSHSYEDTLGIRLAEILDSDGKMYPLTYDKGIPNSSFQWDYPLDIAYTDPDVESGSFTFDITRAVKNNIDSNVYSFAARIDDGAMSGANASFKCTTPILCLEFISLSGSNQKLAKHSFDVNDAGVAYLDDLTGGLFVERTDMDFGGQNSSVLLNMLYTVQPNKQILDMVSNEYYTRNWTTNYNMVLKCDFYTGFKQAINYSFIDNYGQQNFFTYSEDEEKYINNDGYELDLSLASNFHDLGNIRVKKDGIIYDFDDYGRVALIRQDGKAEKSTITIRYRDNSVSGMNISKITDGSGRYYEFVYKSDGTLSDIYFKNQNGVVISRIGYVFRKVNAGIGEQYLLDKVNYYGDSSEVQKSVSYGYTTANSPDGKQYLLSRISYSKKYSL